MDLNIHEGKCTLSHYCFMLDAVLIPQRQSQRTLLQIEWGKGSKENIEGDKRGIKIMKEVGSRALMAFCPG